MASLKSGENARDDQFKNVRWITNEDRPDCRSANDEQFGWLHENQKVPFFHKIAPGDAAENDDNTNNRKH